MTEANAVAGTVKIDVVIPTRSPDAIRKNLLSVLESEPWVNRIIIETSSPLSLARVNAAKRCTTGWVMYCDDDAEIPRGLLNAYIPYMKGDVIAVSSQSNDQDKRWLHHHRALLMLKPDHHLGAGIFDNRAFVIRRAFMLSHRPKANFYCEDVELCNRVRERGLWVHLPYCGIKHFPTEKSFVPFGYEMWRLRLWANNSRLFPFKNFLVHLGIACVMALSSWSPRSVLWRIRQDVQWFAGYLMAVMDGY